MEQYELELFLHLSETLHFGRSSDACHVSPSTLSRTIRRLEEEVGDILFDRDNRSVALTRAGRLLRAYALESRERLAALRSEVANAAAPLRGELSIYASVTACYSILPAILAEYRARFPAVHINLRTGDAARAAETALAGEVDVAVAAIPRRVPERLEHLVITVTPLVFIAPTTACAVRDQVRLPDVPWENVPMILSASGLARERTEQWFRDRGGRPNIYAQVSGNEAILAMVSLGCGIGVVPELVINKSPLQSEIARLPVDPALAPYEVGIVSLRKRMRLPTAEAFWEVVRSMHPSAPAGAGVPGTQTPAQTRRA